MLSHWFSTYATSVLSQRRCTLSQPACLINEAVAHMQMHHESPGLGAATILSDHSNAFCPVRSQKSRWTWTAVCTAPDEVDFTCIPIYVLLDGLVFKIDKINTAMALALLTAANNRGRNQFWFCNQIILLLKLVEN